MKTKLGLIVLMLLALVLGYVLYNTIEIYEDTTDQGWSIRALRNPFLAAELFLDKRGYEVETSKSIKRLDQLPDGGTIFLSDASIIQNKSRLDSLLEWMNSGGHLIVGTHTSTTGNSNVITDYFGFEKRKVDCECLKDEDDIKKELEKKLSEILRETNEQIKKGETGKKTDSDKKPEIPIEELTKLHFDGVDQAVRVHFGFNHALFHPSLEEGKSSGYQGQKPFYWAANQAGVQFLQFDVGEGLLTVLSDNSIWYSQNIDKVDHAYLLTILADNRGEVLLLSGIQVPSIFEMLNRFAPQFIPAVLIWLIIWIVYKARRFGPTREIEYSLRRSLDEHVRACGTHLWRSKKRNKMLENLQAAIFRKINRAHLSFSKLDRDKQLQWISRQCDLSEKDITLALYSTSIDSEDDFNNLVRLIQIIGNRL